MCLPVSIKGKRGGIHIYEALLPNPYTKYYSRR